jgi:hypothetical protein
MRSLAVVLLLAAATTAPAQQQPASVAVPAGARYTWSTNPLGFLQLGPNIEFERATSTAHAVGFGVRAPTLGLYTYLLNEDVQSGWSAYGIYRFYPRRQALHDWYVGPHLEFGGTSNDTYTSQILGFGGEFGHRWIKSNGFAIVLGGLLGVLKSNDTWKDGTGSAGNETYVIWMLNLSLGVAR